LKITTSFGKKILACHLVQKCGSSDIGLIANEMNEGLFKSLVGFEM
jgi:hypothetical protein